MDISETIEFAIKLISTDFIIGCSNCPFSSEHSDINSSDPDEGYYNCELMGAQKVWGEEPVCTDEQWQEHVRKFFKGCPCK